MRPDWTSPHLGGIDTRKGIVDTAERLAAYLAGDLDAAATAAVEEDLARDASLRGQLAAMRRADAALDELPSPEPPAGFEERLRAELDPVLAERLGTDHSTADAASTAPASATPASEHGTFDQLAERRAARAARPAGARNRWVPALAGVAAAAAAIAVLSNVADLGVQDAEEGVAADMADDDAGEESFSTMEAPTEEADDGAAGALPVPDGPVVVASGRVFEQADVEALLAEPDLLAVAAQGWTGEFGTMMAESWSATFGVEQRTATLETAPDEAVGDDAADADEGADGERALAEPAPLREVGQPFAADVQQDVQRCLATITDTGGSVIPAYVELGVYEGEDAIIYGLVSVDPDTGAYTRTELWVLGRDDCEVRHWRQS